MPVKTRSMLRLIAENTIKCSSTIEFGIDFDEASVAWRQNKNVLPNGCFSYKNKELSNKSTKTVKK